MSEEGFPSENAASPAEKVPGPGSGLSEPVSTVGTEAGGDGEGAEDIRFSSVSLFGALAVKLAETFGVVFVASSLSSSAGLLRSFVWHTRAMSLQMIASVLCIWFFLGWIRVRENGVADVGLRLPVARGAWLLTLRIYATAVLCLIGLSILLHVVDGDNVFRSGNDNVSRLLGEFVKHGPGSPAFLLIFLQVAVFAPVEEELCFRGIGWAGMMNSGSTLRAYIWTSVVFALLHGFTRSPFMLIQGIAFGHIRHRTGSLYCAMAAHAFNNALIMGLLAAAQAIA